MSIRIFYDEIDFRLKEKKKVVKIIEKVIREKNNISGDLSFIFTNDETLRKINLQFLGQDYDTDVISFDYNEKNVVNGEIYISIETVMRNAINYDVSLTMEVKRVMIHGILHLLGFEDMSEEQKRIMRNMEDLWLRKLDE